MKTIQRQLDAIGVRVRSEWLMEKNRPHAVVVQRFCRAQLSGIERQFRCAVAEEKKYQEEYARSMASLKDTMKQLEALEPPKINIVLPTAAERQQMIIDRNRNARTVQVLRPRTLLPPPPATG